MTEIKLQTGPGVFEVLAHVCRSPQEAVKQFAENAADAIEQLAPEERGIWVHLQYEGAPGARALKAISIRDRGAGMSLEKMRQVMQHIGQSEKLDSALRGEKGIGILAFALIAQELHLASTDQEGAPSNCLVLKKEWLRSGSGAIVEHCPRHIHTHRGTSAHLEGILPEVAGPLSKERLKEYLGSAFSSDLREGLYPLLISDNAHFEPVHPHRLRGVKVFSQNLSLGPLGHAFVELYVLPWDAPDASVSLHGRGGMRICLLSDLPEFQGLPWTDKRLEGYIRCDRLKRTADKTAVVQDQVYQAFVRELRGIAPGILKQIERVSQETQVRRFDAALRRANRLIDKFVRYREQGILDRLSPTPALAAGRNGGNGHSLPIPSLREATDGARPAQDRPIFSSARVPSIHLSPPSQDKTSLRSWYDPARSAICINREHSEFLLSEKEQRRCIRYLFSVWAKETLLQEFGADAPKVADEMVGVLAEAEPLLW